ncbi:MarR family winged helix-turn-helix transcriptional regulator [Roseobacter sp. EG26]|uniref:MarR family winged helix-turn-helix transcriptional regulator n=1 Tax=Roseobacter sp. EG26 TaxID=3412477 RepID=UPI003CE4A097
MVDRSPTKDILSTVIDKRDDTFLSQNIKGMMMTLIARWNARMDDARADTEFADVRPADIRVFAQLRGRTIRLPEIHREMGYSRQAAQQAVDRLVGHDMIAVSNDPTSKRDKLVSITEKGQRWRAIAAEQIRQIEDEIGEAIGEDAKEALRGHLARLASEK